MEVNLVSDHVIDGTVDVIRMITDLFKVFCFRSNRN